MIELEKTYLAKRIPDGLKKCKFKEIVDVYIPENSEHPKLRIRKSGNKFEITKKMPVKEGDASYQEEQTIVLAEAEFNELNRLVGKKVRKIRYYYNYNGRTAEVDLFQDSLSGLVLVDFEFATIEEKNSFRIPDFCLADVTQELFLAGGMLCGKSYEDIENGLKKFGYQRLFVE